MKRTIVALFALFMVLGSVAGETIEVGQIYDTGAPSLEYAESQIPWWQQLTSTTFTMIDGALCSTHADWERYYTVSTNGQICYTNLQYTGVAFQVFRTTNGWVKLGERQLSYGERGCFPTEAGNTYLAHAYFCADTQKTCTNFVSVESCQEPDDYTIRERSCTQNGVTTTERVTVDWYDSQALNVCAPAAPTPGTGADGGDTADPGDSPTVQSCSGDWVSVDFPENVALGAEVSGIAKFRADRTATCLMSATINPTGSPLSQITASSNVDTCGDPSPYYAEVFAQVEGGKFYDVTFNNVLVPESEGSYAAQVSAFNGCTNDGGVVVDMIEDRMQVGQGSQGTNGLSAAFWTGLVAIGGAVLLLFGIVLLAGAFSKRR